MCGIFGFYNPKPKDKLYWADHLIPELFFVDQIRGRDACGVFAQTEVGAKPDHVKMAGPADEFISWKSAHERFFQPAEGMRFMVGHNRAATQGKDDVDGAHPHVVGNIHLVHNGTLSSWNRKDFHSDSHQIAAWLEENPDFREVERKIFGAYALVWHDARDDSLNFVRNDQRPMHFVRTSDDGIWFGSEADMLVWILKRRNKNIKEVKELRPRLWLKFRPDHKIKEITVPFTKHGTAGSENTKITAAEEYFTTKESSRATETLEHGHGKIREWGACEFKAAKVVPPSRPTLEVESSESSTSEVSKQTGHDEQKRPSWLPIVYSPGGQRTSGNGYNYQEEAAVLRRNRHESGSAAASKKDSVFALKKFMGLEVGDVVHFYPMKIAPARLDSAKLQVEGVLAVYDFSGNISFVPGVEVSTRLDPELENLEEPVTDRIGQLTMTDVIHQTVITAVTYDDIRKRIRVYCKDSVPQEWFDFADYPGADRKEAKDAWDKPYIKPDAASEVAAEEKKSYEAGTTFS